MRCSKQMEGVRVFIGDFCLYYFVGRAIYYFTYLRRFMVSGVTNVLLPLYLNFAYTGRSPCN
jgi:hypothetical protein